MAIRPNLRHKAKSIAIVNGEATVIAENHIFNKNQIDVLCDNEIIQPHRRIDLSRVSGILLNSGIIRFQENSALLNFAIQESQNRTIMSQLGKVAEAIIVKRCADLEETNYRLFCIATGKRARRETARQFEACGTSLIDTKTFHARHYNPQDTQRDIIFINSSDKIAFMSNATSVAGKCAGLQIKTSNNIINYVVHDIIDDRYCVPIICFPLMAFPNTVFKTFEEEIVEVKIYDALIQKITGKKTYIDRLLRSHRIFFENYTNKKNIFESRLYDLLSNIIFDIKDIDLGAFEELLYIKGIIELLVQGRIYPDDLLKESEALKSALLSIGLSYVSPSIETNNILIT